MPEPFDIAIFNLDTRKAVYLGRNVYISHTDLLTSSRACFTFMDHISFSTSLLSAEDLLGICNMRAQNTPPNHISILQTVKIKRLIEESPPDSLYFLVKSNDSPAYHLYIKGCPVDQFRHYQETVPFNVTRLFGSFDWVDWNRFQEPEIVQLCFVGGQQ